MHDYADKSRGPRLQKVLAQAGVASRRDCEALIAEGRVKINGEVITELPAWVDPQQDKITVDGEAVTKPKASRFAMAGKTYVMLYKPRRVITTTDDEQGRRTVMDLIDIPGAHKRLFPVGRLDADSTGLLLLTDDGELTQRLTHPKYDIPKRYRVTVKGRVEDKDIERLKKGLILAHRGTTERRPASRKATMSRVRRLNTVTDRARGDRTDLLIELREGQNREIRRLMARLGFNVSRLKRVQLGPLKLSGLSNGQWRLLKPEEKAALYKAVGLKNKQAD